MRILIVDDEPSVARATRRVLSTILSDAEIVIVDRAEKALEQLGGEKPFDVLISDLAMPEMDGFALLRAVAEEFPDVGRVLYTAGAGGLSLEAIRLRLPRGTEVVPKPFTLVQLTKAIWAVTKEPPAAVRGSISPGG